MPEQKRPRKYYYRQLGLAICSSLGFYSVGLLRGFSSPGIPSMERTSPYLVSTGQDKSWITSVAPLGGAVGCLLCAPLMHYLGRRTVIQIAGPIFSITWISIALSESVPILVISRGINGICGGIFLPAVQVYVSETSDHKIRGLMASLPAVIMVFGLLMQFVTGLLVEWRTMSWISAIIPALILPLISLFPESPDWLRHKKSSKEEASRKWYGLERRAENQSLVDINCKQTNTFTLSKHVMIPFSFALAMMVFQQTCGNDVLTYNAVTLFREAGSEIDANLAGIAVAIVHFIATILSIFVVDRLGRRPLLLFSSLIMGLCLTAVAIYFGLQRAGKSDGYEIVPLISLLIYIAAFSLGFCTVPFILVGEIIPLAQRSILGPVTTFVGLLSIFIELKTYSNLTYWLGQEGAFSVYSILNFLAFAFVYFLLPETKGKSLDDIEDYFRKKYKIKIVSSNL